MVTYTIIIIHIISHVMSSSDDDDDDDDTALRAESKAPKKHRFFRIESNKNCVYVDTYTARGPPRRREIRRKNERRQLFDECPSASRSACWKLGEKCTEVVRRSPASSSSGEVTWSWTPRCRDSASLITMPRRHQS